MTGGIAKWITYANPEAGKVENKNPWENALDRADQFAPIADVGGVALFRKQFTVEGLKSARVDATALGVFDIWVNGQRVGRLDEDGKLVYDEMKPGWTDYRERVLYYSYDLAPYLTEGENTLLIAVAPGWWNGRIALGTYGENHISLLAAIHLLDAKGEKTLTTDESWQGAWGSAIRASDIWDGELYDANYPTLAGLSKGCNCVAWCPVTTESYDIFVSPQVGPTIMVREGLTRTPETINIFDGVEDNGSDYGKVHVVRSSAGEDSFALTKGETAVIDLGQNMVGWPTFTVKGEKGTTVQVRVGEMLNDSGLESRGNDNPEGSVYTINYRSAKAKAYYILKGEEAGEYYCPTFTFFGFRYLEISATEAVEITGLACPVIGSATRETATMVTSNEDVNRLISNVIWGQRGNYLSVPTDCPQRDERLGWTGDAQIFCRTAAINFDVEKFFRKWMRDLAIEQAPDGSVRGTVPDSMGTHPTRISAAWGDVACVVPWELYMAYGNKAMLREQFPTMVRWVEYMHATGDEEFLWLTGQHYGDWLAMDAGEDSYVGATSCDFIASAFFAYSTDLLVRAGETLGKDVAKYREMHAKICARILEYFFEADGTPKAKLPLTEILPPYRLNKPPVDQVRSCMTQTTLVLMLHFGLCPEKDRERYGNMLVQMIRENGNLMSTGFVGTPYLLHALTATGHTDVAYELLMEERAPSWLYSVNHGATTMWEHWNSLKEDGSFWSTEMNSFNHYAYGSVYDWIFGAALGIKPTAPAYREIEIAPHPDKCLGWAEGSIESRSGRIRSHWYYKGDVVYYEFDIPEGVTARVTLPSGFEACLGGGSYRFAE